ncbi:MAG: prolyl oligopeptidase family serine peptidase [Candidatus Competibacterales bacterium]
MTQRIAPYGQWASPISADLIVGQTVSLGSIALDGQDVYWIESRPLEQGRNAIVRHRPGGANDEVLPMPYSARSRVHEYGGGAFTVHRGEVFFVEQRDQQWYHLAPGQTPKPLTDAPHWRFADPAVDTPRQRLICVGEDHAPGEPEPSNCLVAIPLGGTAVKIPKVLVRGADFYASPTLSPDHRRLAWLTWDHPQMPWDGTTLWVAEVADDGALKDPKAIAGGPKESIFQPQWGPGGTLYFVSDRSGFWNLYRFDGDVEAVMTMEADFGRPLWQFGQSTFAVARDGGLYGAFNRLGRWQLAFIGADGQFRSLELPYTEIDELRLGADKLVFRAGAPTEGYCVVTLDRVDHRRQPLKQASVPLDLEDLSVPEVVAYPADGGSAYAFFYPPTNRHYQGTKDTKPPLLVKSHGGPTGAAQAVYQPLIQYWTSRGFAVLDVNYRGSTGFGRAYREALYGQWGVVDVDDCVAAARWACSAGRADPERCAIRGSSAGGYTTLAALAFRDFFKAGASYYGVGDLETLLRDTHKFESRYLDHLIGPYPQQRQRYLERSPLHHNQALSAPVIFFQGLLDKVVPPNQAEDMVTALKRRGIPVAYMAFDGEHHGFRQAANIKRALEAELYFYGRVFGFTPFDPLTPVTIDGL